MNIVIWFFGFLITAFVSMTFISYLGKKNAFFEFEKLNKEYTSFYKTMAFFGSIVWFLFYPMVAVLALIYALYCFMYKLSDKIVNKKVKEDGE